ncbi:hypothetical protein BDC45DRAFT_559859 [Circinella umbellata]|nr:hypothetical protein BDC45DRAFT_559859 [Circinella umbellata]
MFYIEDSAYSETALIKLGWIIEEPQEFERYLILSEMQFDYLKAFRYTRYVVLILGNDYGRAKNLQSDEGRANFEQASYLYLFLRHKIYSKITEAKSYKRMQYLLEISLKGIIFVLWLIVNSRVKILILKQASSNEILV